MGDDIIQRIDPLWFRFGLFGMRYYTALFVAALVAGYLLFRWQADRASYPRRAVRDTLWFGIPATIIGARLAHCIFYAPDHFFAHPITVLFLWQGGVASHGALAAIPLALLAVSRRHGLAFTDVLDRFTFSAALGAALIRLGNFFNSEIVGRETTLPWGMRFIRFDGGAVRRHPSQLYELAMGIFVLGLLLYLDRRLGRERRPRGLLAAVFLLAYFTLRFLVEFVKAPQRPGVDSILTMGQYLSIPPIVVGALLLWRVLRKPADVTDSSA